MKYIFHIDKTNCFGIHLNLMHFRIFLLKSDMWFTTALCMLTNNGITNNNSKTDSYNNSNNNNNNNNNKYRKGAWVMLLVSLSANTQIQVQNQIRTFQCSDQ